MARGEAQRSATQPEREVNRFDLNWVLHDGRAHVYADKNSIHVMSVKMLKGGSMNSDSMSK
jgi:hypothetical protein